MTELTVLQRELAAELAGVELRFHERMSKHTSFRIGAGAEVMAFPKNTEQLRAVLTAANATGCQCRILGAGTNILAPDEGLGGVVICLKDCLDGTYQLDATHIRIMAGVTMTRAAMFAAGLGLSGLEFAHGIPGTVGGGVYMNAGAYGGEICQVCESVEVMDQNGEVKTLSAEDMEFSYRHSRLEKEFGIVTSAVFHLIPKPEEEIKSVMRELMKKRSASQPLDMPSAGSAFKRPAHGYAAALIDEAGLKGFRVGNAAVSEKHAGFVVNLGGASAGEVRELLRQVSDCVFDKSGIRLEPEVRIWK